MITAPGHAGTEALDAELLVPHAASSAFLARRIVGEDLTQRGVADHLRDSMILVLSELLSNAVKHARPLADGKVHLAWGVTSAGVELAVTDGGSPTRPRVPTSTVSETGGRGLAIVRDLAADWGVTEDPSGTTVWARLPQPGAPVAAAPGPPADAAAPMQPPPSAPDD